MDESHRILDNIIFYLRGHIDLKNFLKLVRFDLTNEFFGDALRRSLQSLQELREESYIGNKFRKNHQKGRKRIMVGERWLYRSKLERMIKNEEDITEELKKYKKILPKTTFYRLKNDIKELKIKKV